MSDNRLQSSLYSQEDRHVCKQYADDAAIRAHSAADLQSSLDGSL